MREEAHRKGIRAILGTREDLLQIIIIAAGLALGVNLVAAYLFSALQNYSVSSLLLGVALILLGSAYLLFLLFGARQTTHSFEAVIHFDPSTREIIPVDGYGLSEQLGKTLRAVFLENEAMRLAWDEEPLGPKMPNPASTDNAQSKATEVHEEHSEPSYVAITRMAVDQPQIEHKAARILREVVEFCLLEKLSTHLSGHFQNYQTNDRLIKEYTRENIPDLLLQNRVLALLSTPIEDRPIFVKSKIFQKPPSGLIFSIWGSDGSVYNRFDLVLPTGTKVSRPSPGCLRLENNRLIINLEASYLGVSAVTPRYFEEIYIGKRSRELHTRKIDITLSIQVKPSALIRLKGWEYYEWIDSFVVKLCEFASFQDFLNRIGWSTVVTQMRLMRIAQRRQHGGRSSPSNRESPEHDT